VIELRARLSLEKAKRNKAHSDFSACENQSDSVTCEEVLAEPVQTEPVKVEDLAMEAEHEEQQVFDWKLIDLTEFALDEEVQGENEPTDGFRVRSEVGATDQGWIIYDKI